MIGVAKMSFLESLGLSPKEQRPDPCVTMACVTDAVDRALEQHHEARVAIRDGNGKVINMLNAALSPDTPANPTKQ